MDNNELDYNELDYNENDSENGEGSGESNCRRLDFEKKKNIFHF